MRIHTDKINSGTIYDTARGVGAHAYRVEPHGSRSHSSAYEVNLEGSSPRRTQNDRDRYAATYDQWGHFLAALYSVDPSMQAGPYKNVSDFKAKTHGAY